MTRLRLIGDADFEPAIRLALNLGHDFFVGTEYEANEDFAVYLTKLRYDASASIWFGDNFLEMSGIGGPAAT